MPPPSQAAIARQPMRVEVAEEQCDLKEDQAGQPDSGGSAQDWEKLFGGHRLRQEEQESAAEDCDAVEQAGCRHVVASLDLEVARRRRRIAVQSCLAPSKRDSSIWI